MKKCPGVLGERIGLVEGIVEVEDVELELVLLHLASDRLRREEKLLMEAPRCVRPRLSTKPRLEQLARPGQVKHRSRQHPLGFVQHLSHDEVADDGVGVVVEELDPVQVPGLTGQVSVAVGSQSACSVGADGHVRCWGLIENGDPKLLTPQLVQTASGPLSSIVAITGSYNHYCALTSGGAVFCWGLSYQGQMGNGASFDSTHLLAVKAQIENVTSVVAAWTYTCASTTDGQVYCWGDDGSCVLTELELVEPSLFFRHSPAAAATLADALLRRVALRR